MTSTTLTPNLTTDRTHTGPDREPPEALGARRTASETRPRGAALAVMTRLRDAIDIAVEAGESADAAAGAKDSTVVVSYDGSPVFRLSHVRTPVAALLERAASGPVPVTASENALSGVEARQWVAIVERLGAAVVRSLVHASREIVAIEALVAGATYTPVELSDTTAVRLGKFSYLRRRDGRVVLESPLSKVRAVLSDDTGQDLVAALARGTTVAALRSSGLDAEAARGVVGHLVGAGFVDRGVATPTEPVFPADSDDVLRQWDFHDLLFHSRSRMGRTDEPYGGRFPYVGEIEPLPAVKPPPSASAIPLHRPKLEDIQAHDPTLVAAMEARQSVRTYGSTPITFEQLGTFLYRVARVRGTYGPRPGRGMPYEASSRPYPCGGAGYELELYLTVQRCVGLAPGAYWYDPLGHQLFLVNDDPAAVESLIALARTSTGGSADPDVLFTMASRFQRLSWKYQSIAYAVTLKHAGVLYQTMYLVATAMGLAPCGLGSGDSDLTGKVLGLDYLKESAVGEFILGSLPDRVSAPETAGPQPDWRPANDPSWQIDVLPRRA